MKAIIEIASNADLHRHAVEAARRLAAGRVEAVGFRLGFESVEQLFSELTAERLRVLEALRREGTRQLPPLAALLGRNEVDVLGDIDRLIELGLVDQSGEDYGTPYDELEIHLPLVAQAA